MTSALARAEDPNGELLVCTRRPDNSLTGGVSWSSAYDRKDASGFAKASSNNKYFTLKPGSKFTYQDKMGTECIELTVTNETKQLMGVTTRGVRVTEWRNGALKEDTMDWYAQDNAGNVWYFGEAVNNYRDGKLIHHTGSWEAGVDGAKPGMIMRADPKVGDTYRQEYYKGYAEDMGTIVATDKKITVPYRTFENCLQIKDWSQIDSTNEYKFYCPAVGFLVREETIRGAIEADLIGVSRQ